MYLQPWLFLLGSHLLGSIPTALPSKAFPLLLLPWIGFRKLVQERHSGGCAK